MIIVGSDLVIGRFSSATGVECSPRFGLQLSRLRIGPSHGVDVAIPFSFPAIRAARRRFAQSLYGPPASHSSSSLSRTHGSVICLGRKSPDPPLYSTIQ